MSEPSGLAFDGSNIWVANLGAKSVTKLQANDGTVLGAFNVENLPGGVAFDGTAIWAANSSSGTVTKLEASNGATLGTFTVGKGPTGVVSDGANLFSQSGGATPLKSKSRTTPGAAAAARLAPRLASRRAPATISAPAC